MAATIEKLPGKAFLPYEEMTDLLLSEFKTRFSYTPQITNRYGDLIYVESYPLDAIPYWCRCCMEEPFLLHFDSIGDAANELKKIQRSWAPYSYTCFRRQSLLQEKLPYVNLKPKKFNTVYIIGLENEIPNISCVFTTDAESYNGFYL